jgi:glucosylceramidase
MRRRGGSALAGGAGVAARVTGARAMLLAMALALPAVGAAQGALPAPNRAAAAMPAVAGPGAASGGDVPAPIAGNAVRAGYAGAWLTTADRSAVLARQPDVALGAPAKALTPWSPGVETAGPLPAGPHAITIDLAGPGQPVLGFGATLSASSAWLLQRLDAAGRAALLDELFGRKGHGLGLGFVRLYLGASEFARSRYSYGDGADGAEVAEGVDDPGLAQVSLAPDREHVIPMALEALARNPALEFIGSPTSAPAWMKTSGSLLQGALKPDAYAAYARYLRRVADLYLEEGIALHALTLQNDPQGRTVDAPADAPGMRLDAKARAELAGRHLGPLLQEGGPRLLEWDGDWDGAAGVRSVLADKAAKSSLAGVAWHCHGGAPDAQGALHADWPGSEAYITECSGGNWAPDWGGNLLYFARVLAGGVRHGARGIALGNLALDEHGGPRTGGCRGCRGVVTIAAGGVVRNPEYYALAHASRWVLPGARALPAGDGRDGVEQAAFVNPDGSVVLLLVNSAPAPRPVTVKAGTRGFGYTLPAGSVATLAWRP